MILTRVKEEKITGKLRDSKLLIGEQEGSKDMLFQQVLQAILSREDHKGLQVILMIGEGTTKIQKLLQLLSKQHQ